MHTAHATKHVRVRRWFCPLSILRWASRFSSSPETSLRQIDSSDRRETNGRVTSFSLVFFLVSFLHWSPRRNGTLKECVSASMIFIHTDMKRRSLARITSIILSPSLDSVSKKQWQRQRITTKTDGIREKLGMLHIPLLFNGPSPLDIRTWRTLAKERSVPYCEWASSPVHRCTSHPLSLSLWFQTSDGYGEYYPDLI